MVRFRRPWRGINKCEIPGCCFFICCNMRLAWYDSDFNMISTWFMRLAVVRYAAPCDRKDMPWVTPPSKGHAAQISYCWSNPRAEYVLLGEQLKQFVLRLYFWMPICQEHVVKWHSRTPACRISHRKVTLLNSNMANSCKSTLLNSNLSK
jgi:hypothetical protein